jgi:hypothetical protein
MTPTKWTSRAVEGSHTRRQHHHPRKGFPPAARVERTLLSAAFDFALGFAFDFDFAFDLPVK